MKGLSFPTLFKVEGLVMCQHFLSFYLENSQIFLSTSQTLFILLKIYLSTILSNIYTSFIYIYNRL